MSEIEFIIKLELLSRDNRYMLYRVRNILPEEIYNSKATMFGLLDSLVSKGWINNYTPCQVPQVSITEEGIKQATLNTK